MDTRVDRRKGEPSGRRVPLAQVEEVLRLYREVYYDLNVRHFREKLREEHGIRLATPGCKTRAAPEASSAEAVAGDAAAH